jgi:hypothetical protein
LRAALRRRVAWRPIALCMAIALSVASGIPAVQPGVEAARPVPVPSRAADWTEVAPPARRASSIATEVAAGRSTSDTALGSSLWAAVSASGNRPTPIATIEPLTVEQGRLTVHWRDTDGSGANVASQAVRIEAAPATPGGCADFSPVGGVALETGIDTYGTLWLGSPPSSGCLRVSIELADRGGRTSIITGQPYRIQPAATASVVKSKPAAARWAGKFNLYRDGAFVTQKTFRWCVAASVQMMVNLVRNHTDRTMATQARMIAYAQRWDNGPYGEDGGTDVTGWTTALRHFGAGNYRAVGTTTPAKALRLAATAMRQTGRPAGILVMEGRHAWVLHGFESRTDPRRDGRARITAVRVSGPLYPAQRTGGYDPHPNTRLSIGKLARYFQPSIVGSLAGRYVVIIPTH